MKKTLLLLMTVVLMATTTFAQTATEYELTYDWHSLVKSKNSSIGNWMSQSADGELLALHRFQSKQSDTITFLNNTFIGSKNTNTSGANHIILTKSDYNGNMIWGVSSDVGDVYNGLNYATATKDGGAFLAMAVRHTSKNNDDEYPENLLFRVKDATGAVTEVTAERPAEGRIWMPLLIKISKNGAIEWTKVLSIGYEPAPAKPDKILHAAFQIDGVTEDDEGNLYFGGALARKMTIDGIEIPYHNVSDDWNGDFIQYRQGNSFLIKLDKTGKAIWAKPSGGAVFRDAIRNLTYSNGYLYVYGTVKGTGKGVETFSYGSKSITIDDAAERIYLFRMNTTTSEIDWLTSIQSVRGSFINSEEIFVKEGKLYAIGRFVGGFGKVANGEPLFETAPRTHTPLIFSVDIANGNMINAAQRAGGTNYTGFFIKDDNIWAFGYNFGQVYMDVYNNSLERLETYEKILTISSGIATAYNASHKDGKIVLEIRGRKEFSILNKSMVIQKEDKEYPLYMGGLLAFNATKTSGTDLNSFADENSLRCYATNGTLQILLSAPQDVAVYSITGTLIYRQQLPVGQSSISLPEKGIYIVKSNKTVQKVIVK